MSFKPAIRAFDILLGFLLTAKLIFAVVVPTPSSGCTLLAPILFFNVAVGSPVTQGNGFMLQTRRLKDNGTGVSAVLDSARPPSLDLDLGSPNQDCGGPGVGEAGARGQRGENCIPLGKILIAHSDDVLDLRAVCSNSTSHPKCVPNDPMDGSEFVFTFTEPAILHKIVMLDVDEKEKSLSITYPDNKEMSYTGFGHNSVLNITIPNMFVAPGEKLAIKCTCSCALVRVDRSLCNAGQIEAASVTETPSSFLQALPSISLSPSYSSSGSPSTSVFPSFIPSAALSSPAIPTISTSSSPTSTTSLSPTQSTSSSSLATPSISTSGSPSSSYTLSSTPSFSESSSFRPSSPSPTGTPSSSSTNNLLITVTPSPSASQIETYFVVVQSQGSAIISRSWSVVDNRKYNTWQEAQERLSRYPASAQTPSRAVIEVQNGIPLADPHTIAGQNQGGGPAAGWNKFWWNWWDINGMVAAAKRFASMS